VRNAICVPSSTDPLAAERHGEDAERAVRHLQRRDQQGAVLRVDAREHRPPLDEPRQAAHDHGPPRAQRLPAGQVGVDREVGEAPRHLRRAGGDPDLPQHAVVLQQVDDRGGGVQHRRRALHQRRGDVLDRPRAGQRRRHLLQHGQAGGHVPAGRQDADLLGEALGEGGHPRGLLPRCRGTQLVDERLDVPAPEDPLHRRRLQGQQAGVAGVAVSGVQRCEVALTGRGRGLGQPQQQVRDQGAALGRLHRLALDLVAGVGELVLHGAHDGRELRRERDALVGRRADHGELAHEVVDVRLGRQEQVGRHVAELDGETPVVLVRPGLQQRVEVELRIVRRGLAARPGRRPRRPSRHRRPPRRPTHAPGCR
jgi:hypothetical protein